MTNNVIILDDKHYIKNSKVVKKVEGYGINDADYTITPTDVNGDRKMCKYYARWKNMIQRCYSKSFKEYNTNYDNVTVCEEWLYFSNFKSWMEQQDWKGKELDKDLIVYKNTVYSPDACVFIPSNINNFMTRCSKARGDYYIGASSNGIYGFRANLISIETKRKYTVYGLPSPEEAHRLWQTNKIGSALFLKNTQTDKRIRVGLQRIADKIQHDLDNNLITEDF